jgi:hypothetical protein
MTFCGQILEDGMILSDAQVRIGRQDGRLVGNEFIQVHTTPIVRVKLRTDLLLLHLAEWDPAVVTAADLKQALAQQHGISGSSSRLLRRYPQARPMLIKNEQQLYGFAGEVSTITFPYSNRCVTCCLDSVVQSFSSCHAMSSTPIPLSAVSQVDRGRYLRKPYPGAFHGCGNTTPPGLVLEVITNEQAQHYEKEVGKHRVLVLHARNCHLHRIPVLLAVHLRASSRCFHPPHTHGYIGGVVAAA